MRIRHHHNTRSRLATIATLMLNADLAPALAFQERSLQAVSRTFALTIPRLPQGLREPVGNGYLLCRIADTIEDDPELSWSEKARWQEAFVAVVQGRAEPDAFARDFAAVLSPQMPAGERELIRNTPLVIQVTRSFNATQQEALARCVAIMGSGMAKFQEQASRAGLADLAALDSYCYVVAGVVGEMLTTLFIDYEPRLVVREADMQRLAVRFGQGLQMTNILKDFWTDWERGVNWLPRDLLARHGVDVAALAPGQDNPAFQHALLELVAIAGRHLDAALRYTLMIPREQTGMRDFCLWAIAMAVLTLRRIAAQPAFQRAEQVKISRDSVRRVVWMSQLLHRSDELLRLAFRVGVRPLPQINGGVPA
ncbi:MULTISPECIES: phytoene/squalene synthase family protein [Acidithiobacillus]|jgi:farnesyl-diphosphate farnesyltransferase|uniref:Squalene synthase n=1 Tax=Acidithiobacillus caldus (strain SM-1) TaxID=990288 RepID=F9ZR91_ACICS|nr:MULTISPECIES: phytoene/squalene synthase family protein [Acidithiobacillus]AEK58889.1 squalene synthase [Acidithiobacillus caldus SM-1]QER43913.1 Squalene/phytoene synthase [Acidithiobacillus caldus]WMT48099.1 MAG: phytoene/squalene synthase family protein [Acidithiobacillus caldus]